MLDLIYNLILGIKKHTDHLIELLIDAFIINSLKKFDLENIAKLLKEKWSLIISCIVYCKNGVVEFLNGFGIAVRGSLLILFLLTLLKLHQAGFIKLNPKQALVIGIFIFALGAVSVLSKMEFTKIETKGDNQPII